MVKLKQCAHCCKSLFYVHRLVKLHVFYVTVCYNSGCLQTCVALIMQPYAICCLHNDPSSCEASSSPTNDYRIYVGMCIVWLICAACATVCYNSGGLQTSIAPIMQPYPIHVCCLHNAVCFCEASTSPRLFDRHQL